MRTKISLPEFLKRMQEMEISDSEKLNVLFRNLDDESKEAVWDLILRGCNALLATPDDQET